MDAAAAYDCSRIVQNTFICQASSVHAAKCCVQLYTRLSASCLAQLVDPQRTRLSGLGLVFPVLHLHLCQPVKVRTPPPKRFSRKMLLPPP